MHDFGGLELGSGSVYFSNEFGREVELSAWFNYDEVVVFVPFFLWDLAGQTSVASIGVQHGEGFASTEDGALEGE